MRLPRLSVALTLGILLASFAAGAQPPAKIARVGVLSPFSPPTRASSALEAFREGLREVGWIEGQNIAFEYRWAEDRSERLPDLAAELVRLRVDVLVSAWGTPAALAAKNATKTVPIVFAGVGDAVGVGLVASLARPGGNMTGLTFITQEAIGKQLELLKEALPRLSRVALLMNPANPAYAAVLRDIEATGRALNVQLQILGVRGPDEFEGAVDAAAKGRAGALLVLRDQVIVAHKLRLLELVAQRRLPTMYSMSEFVHAGGLMAYGPSLPDMYRRAAYHVGKILRGARPADLPVEQAMRFELAVNLKAAKALGLTLPPSVLRRADEVIQ